MSAALVELVALLEDDDRWHEALDAQRSRQVLDVEVAARQIAARHGLTPQTVGQLIALEVEASTTLPAMPADPDTLRALRRVARRAAELTAERDRLIKQAVAEGGSLRAVGEAAGLSHTAVDFIAHGRRGRRS